MEANGVPLQGKVCLLFPVPPYIIHCKPEKSDFFFDVLAKKDICDIIHFENTTLRPCSKIIFFSTVQILK